MVWTNRDTHSAGFTEVLVDLEEVFLLVHSDCPIDA